MFRNHESRRHPRSAKSAPVYLVWNDHWGVDKFINGRSVDISESGIRIEVREPIEKESYVTLCSEQGLQGRALVRSCTRKGVKYLVGLEFSGGRQQRQ